ncbi:MAG: hypothetical protein BM562_03940 [Alphaproteobacteria bacterium MedPE-SWcel]|nr:MAG: hypothetical protein BM562_03940 [Alphaproteobacteria bacterium MedPE-SWcel]
MKHILLALAATSVGVPAMAQDAREMDAHVHGVSTAEIAIEHGKVEITILSPGIDVVGFEYAATSAADKDAVEAAIRSMLTPENIVTLPAAAGCRLTEVLVHLEGGEPDHGDADAHMEEDQDHDTHAGDDDHDHDHGHEEHAQDQRDHEDQMSEGQHSEFHLSYAFACEDEDALTSVGFPFFDRFENAQEIEAQYITETAAGQAEIGRDAPELTLE